MNMFWLDRKSQSEKNFKHLHNLLSISFANVRRDTQNLFQWINHLHQKNLEQENLIRELKSELSYIPKTHGDIKKIIDSHFSIESINDRMKILHDRIDNLYSSKVGHETPMLHPELHNMKERIENLEEQKQATIREKVVKRITRNSKEYVKGLILSYIKKYGQIGALQLKDMIVNDQGLCSKSSFYRILEEVEQMDELGIVKRGRQNYYLFKQIKEH
jgi:hypothetical protein